jgi:hypothetical protein
MSFLFPDLRTCDPVLRLWNAQGCMVAKESALEGQCRINHRARRCCHTRKSVSKARYALGIFVRGGPARSKCSRRSRRRPAPPPHPILNWRPSRTRQRPAPSYPLSNGSAALSRSRSTVSARSSVSSSVHGVRAIFFFRLPRQN